MWESNAECFNIIKNSITNRNDKITWAYSNNGLYSLKTGYRCAKKVEPKKVQLGPGTLVSPLLLCGEISSCCRYL